MEAVSTVLRQELEKFQISVVTVQPGDFSKATHLLDNHHRYIIGRVLRLRRNTHWPNHTSFDSLLSRAGLRHQGKV